MRELVRLDDVSRRGVEAFLSEVEGREISLGRVWLVCGGSGALVTWLGRASGITLGRAIFLAPRFARLVANRGDAVSGGPGPSHIDLLGRLLVHECVHVFQYRRDGFAQFLVRYLFSYCTNLMNQDGRRGIRARLDAAYRAIPYEVEAFRLEDLWEETCIR